MPFANSLPLPDSMSVLPAAAALRPSPTVSQAIALLRFPLVLLVLYLHALPLMVPFAAEAGFFYQLSQLIGQQLARLAVPMLFICAGYLLFCRFEWRPGFYRQLLVKKTHTLLLPFLLWGSLGIGFYAIGLSLPQTQSWFVNEQKLADFWTFSGFVQSLFGIERSPLVYPLWFVRDLLIFVMLSPLLFLLIRLVGWWLMLPLALCWLFDIWWLFQPALSSTVFFVLGALFALKPFAIKPSVVKPSVAKACDEQQLWRFGPLLVGGYVLFQLVNWWYPLPAFFHKLALLLGLAALWFCALWAVRQPKLGQALTFSAGRVFFIFASHEPLLTIVRKISAALLPATVTIQGLLYLLLPIVLAWVLYQSYRLLAVLAPTCCRVLCGGR